MGKGVKMGYGMEDGDGGDEGEGYDVASYMSRMCRDSLHDRYDGCLT